jgi:hypothetical protein
LTRSKELPPEQDISAQEPRVGVFACNCGINIGGVADVPAVREYARTLPYVVHVEDNLFTCSQDTQDKIKSVIQENNINRVVVASCSPRTHEPLFQETIREVPCRNLAGGGGGGPDPGPDAEHPAGSGGSGFGRIAQ